jgi:hypothetical protein
MLIPIFDDVLHIAKRVKEIDKHLYIAFNTDVQRYEVHDMLMPEGQTLVMRVQEPDGSFRPLDNRVLDTLIKNRRERFDEVFKELEEKERKREEAWNKRLEDIALGLADDLKFAGKPVIGGVSFDTPRDNKSSEG